MVEKYSKLKTATAAIISRREDVEERFQKASASELAQTEAELNVAIETSQDDLAVVLIQKKNQLTPDLAELKAELDTAQRDADSAKGSLMACRARSAS
jgi:phage shock protein A